MKNINWNDLEIRLCECCEKVFKVGELMNGLCVDCYPEVEVDQCDLCFTESDPEYLIDGMCVDCHLMFNDDCHFDEDEDETDDGWANCHEPVVCIFDNQLPTIGGLEVIFTGTKMKLSKDIDANRQNHGIWIHIWNIRR